MKKLLLFMATALTLGLTARAADGDTFTVDNLKYTVLSEDERTVSVKKDSEEPTGELVIPANATNNGISYSVTSIGSSAFYQCSGLTSVTIPNSVTSIGNDAFFFCSGLTSVTIPNSVTSIGNNAFQFCSKLTSVTIPASVDEIGNQCFGSCRALEEIIVDKDNKNYMSVDGVVYNSTQSEILICPAGKKGAFAIPNTVTSIGNYAFRSCSGLTSVTIPNSMTSIGMFAFYQCSGLTSVTIPNSVTSIGISVFSGCSGLTSVTIPNSVTSISNYLFEGCSELTSVTIPNSVTSIGMFAFSGCSGLTSVTIPNSVTTIGDRAFYQCSGLTSVTIPNSVTTIGMAAFYQCFKLTSVTIPNSVKYISMAAFWNCYSLTSVTFSNSVTYIGDSAFEFCFALTSVTIPASVEKIGTEAFSGCTALEEIIVDKDNKNYMSVDNVLYNATQSEIICCAGTKKGLFEIPNSVISIGSAAFEHCYGLTSVTIPNSVTSIGSEAFYKCSSLTSVTIPNSVTSISDATFKDCSGLTSVTIPGSLTSIGSNAFNNCTNLYKIHVQAVTPPELKDAAFNEVPQSAAVYVPKGSTDSYLAAEGWNYFSDFRESGGFDMNIDKNLLWLAVDSMATITVSGNTDGGQWESSNPDVATVNSAGEVTAVAPGSATISFTVTDSDGIKRSENCTVNVMGVTFELPENGFVLGEKNKITATVESPISDVTYYWTLTEIGGEGYFGKTSTYKYSVPNRYSLTQTLTSPGEYYFSIVFIPAGYDKELVFAGPRITIEESGIEEIEADGSDAPAEFFNLNGVRVSNPQNGLYIKRQGGKTTKVLIK